MKSSLTSALISALFTTTTALSVDFFYSTTNNTCSYEDNTIIADQELTHGGVCAYAPDTSRIYACPAPDPTCWTWAEDCAGAGGQTGLAGAQITCNRAGTVWCCNAIAGETCTTTANQINVCISNFTSPNAGVSIADANARYQSVVGIAGSSVSATTQTKDPTPFTTLMYALSSGSSSSSTRSSSSSSSAISSSASPTASSGSNSGSSSSSSSGSASVTSSSSTTSSTTAPLIGASKSSGISGGAIGGIIVGIVVILAVVGAICFIMGRRRKSDSLQRITHGDAAERTDYYADLSSSAMSAPAAYASNMAERDRKMRYGGYHAASQKDHDVSVSELGEHGHGRVEIGGETPNMRYEMA